MTSTEKENTGIVFVLALKKVPLLHLWFPGFFPLGVGV